MFDDLLIGYGLYTRLQSNVIDKLKVKHNKTKQEEKKMEEKWYYPWDWWMCERRNGREMVTIWWPTIVEFGDDWRTQKAKGYGTIEWNSAISGEQWESLCWYNSISLQIADLSTLEDD